jgi:hypothetical protein
MQRKMNEIAHDSWQLAQSSGRAGSAFTRVRGLIIAASCCDNQAFFPSSIEAWNWR